ncbi:hypothetical protein FOA52_002309 [Chlamydomonas sp. UWO 241]|nr:hypothetical protein FOA52_002309 [Chlamydomonas sp. UWO 241]
MLALSALRTKDAGWLVNDTLVLTVGVTVEREDRFQLDTGGAPCDVVLKLPCGVEIPVHGQLLPLASPSFRDVLEDVRGDLDPGEPNAHERTAITVEIMEGRIQQRVTRVAVTNLGLDLLVKVLAIAATAETVDP